MTNNESLESNTENNDIDDNLSNNKNKRLISPDSENINYNLYISKFRILNCIDYNNNIVYLDAPLDKLLKKSLNDLKQSGRNWNSKNHDYFYKINNNKLTTIDSVIYLSKCTHSDIAFAINNTARFCGSSIIYDTAELIRKIYEKQFTILTDNKLCLKTIENGHFNYNMKHINIKDYFIFDIYKYDKI
ncbi:hypothetical protein H8356DRAFT_1320823 [Neocallimastix lanati (nom. inval.)]|nr:hypothetical protein H8356DRAFT_1320823 [Neocallimastix sp. JGI-2020a]